MISNGPITKLSLLFFLLVLFATPKTFATAGDGLVVYGEGTVTTPRYRTYTPGAFASESSATTANATIRWAAMKTNTGSTERIMGTLSTAASNNLTIQRWSSGAWGGSVEWQATNSLNAYRGFDIAYESLSGDYLVVYSTGGTSVNYQYGNGGSWSSGSFTFTTGIGNIRWLRLASNLISNEIAVVAVGSNTSGTNVNARIWDTSTNTFGSERSGGLGLDEQNGYDSFDAVYETASGDLMIAWARSASPYWNYATRVGTTWSVVTPAASGGIIYQLSLAASPLSTSDRIALAAMDSLNDLQAGRWGGSAWTLQNDLDGTSANYTSHSADVAFAGTTDNAIIAYADSTANANVDWYRSVAGAAFATPGDYAPAGSPATTENIINLTADASSSKVMLLRAHITSLYLRGHVYDEASYSTTAPYGWSTPTGDPLETTNSGGTAYEGFAFAWESVFKVDALGWILASIAAVFFIIVMVRRRILKVRRATA